jgi:5-methylcytosine-specific restriction endonuclease McrA
MVDQNYTINDTLYTLTLFNNKCFNCGSTKKLGIDHHHPLIKGHGLSRSNAVILCRHYNSAKGTKNPKDYYTKKQLKILHKLGIK